MRELFFVNFICFNRKKLLQIANWLNRHSAKLRLLPFDRLRKNGYGVHRHLRMYKNILKKKESAVLRHSMKLKLLPFDSLKKNKNAAQPYVTSLNKNLMKNRISLYTSFRKRRVLSVKFLVCSALLPGE